MIRRVPTRQRNASIVREPDRGAFVRLVMLLVCGLVLAAGFVYAGRQHFTALKYGYETQDLRKVRDELVAQQHRFILAREEAASPLRLERAARQLGMQPLTAAQIDPLRRPAASAATQPSRPVEVAMLNHPKAASTSRAIEKKPALNEKKPVLRSPIPAKVSMPAKTPTKESRKKPI